MASPVEEMEKKFPCDGFGRIGDVSLAGRLVFFDSHLNLVLGESDDVTIDRSAEGKLGFVMVRGDSIMLIFPSVCKAVAS